MLPDILQVPGLCAANSNMLREILRYYDIPVYTNTALAGTTDEGGFAVRIKAKDAAEERRLEADSCILSVGYVPDRHLADALLSGGFAPEKLHVIGDAHSVGNLMSAIWEAYEVSYRL
jgi:2-enoate reductase